MTARRIFDNLFFFWVINKNKFLINIEDRYLDQTLRVRLGAFTARAAGLAARGDGAEQNPQEGEEGAARDEAGTNQLELQGPDICRHIALKNSRIFSLLVNSVLTFMVTNCAIARHP